MKKNIFITGAAGFIGFHLARHLHQRGDSILGFDNFNDYYSPQLKRDRAAKLKEEGIQVIEGDLCDFNRLAFETENHQTTHFVHLAAQAGVRYSLTNPNQYISSNLQGFLNVLEVCKNIPKIKLIYASSSSVYGLNEKVPFSIHDPTDRQASLYGVTKKTNELMAQTYHHLYGIPVTGLRFFTVYGPWGRPDMAYFSFLKNIFLGKPIDVYNHGKLQRDFTYIDDIVEGTTSAIDLGANCEIFNLGNCNPVELGFFIETIETLAQIKAKKNYLPMQAGDVYTTFADIEKSKQLLNFSPKTSIQIGLSKFIEWYKEYFSSRNIM